MILEQMDKELIEAVKREYPDYTVVAYINTTAALKTICDVCVTSSSAVKIVSSIENPNILFIPDCNLGAYVRDQLPEKNIKLLQGGCPIHASVNEEEAIEAKKKHPGALLLVHPECKPEVVRHADYVGSTSGIMQFAEKSDCREFIIGTMQFAEKSDCREFIIGTELSIAEHLQYACPDKRFYPLSKKLICQNMKLSTLVDVYDAVRGAGGVDLIVTHAPPRGFGDMDDPAHRGFESFFPFLDRYKPAWLVHGHIHMNYGRDIPRVLEYGGTKVINAWERWVLEI